MYHNIQSLMKHYKLISNDSNFNSCGILFLGETWMKSTDKVEIPNFTLIQDINSGDFRKPYGIALYVQNTLCKKISKSNAFTIKDGSNRIDTAWIEIDNYVYLGLYAKPNTSLKTWKKWLQKVSQFYNKKVVILGDFNIDARKKPTSMNSMINSLNLTTKNKSSTTTHFKTCLDWIVSNYDLLCAHQKMKTRGKKLNYRKMVEGDEDYDFHSKIKSHSKSNKIFDEATTSKEIKTFSDNDLSDYKLKVKQEKFSEESCEIIKDSEDDCADSDLENLLQQREQLEQVDNQCTK
ncbi:Endoribonuclease Dcr-1 [Frankliniella fusca]|uniref:Endoribonuclease Dcr-1 n=1 Tax=Frankliniella fusca TaxID=407009 RepID=A0AAE1GR52_9NEOP|nr:Endoribonuclease Dcr-1 [Frankliniella fusca]